MSYRIYIYPVSKVIKDRNQITIQQLLNYRLQITIMGLCIDYDYNRITINDL